MISEDQEPWAGVVRFEKSLGGCGEGLDVDGNGFFGYCVNGARS